MWIEKKGTHLFSEKRCVPFLVFESRSLLHVDVELVLPGPSIQGRPVNASCNVDTVVTRNDIKISTVNSNICTFDSFVAFCYADIPTVNFYSGIRMYPVVYR